MATIGTFTRTVDGFTGKIETLSLNIEVRFKSNRKQHEKSPDYRIIGPSGEFGAAWQRVSAAEREYLSVKFDDPIFPAPVYASLTLGEDDEAWHLIWSR